MAKEYIEREAAKCELLSWAVCMNHPEYLMRDDALHVIDSIPAADVAEVTRCRECKFRSSWMMNRNLRYICPESGMFPNGENDFCSYGKWKGGKDHA